MRWRISVALFVVSTLGLLVTFPLWLLNLISDRALIGTTLVLSWAGLQYEAFNALQISHDAKGGADDDTEESRNEDK